MCRVLKGPLTSEYNVLPTRKQACFTGPSAKTDKYRPGFGAELSLWMASRLLVCLLQKPRPWRAGWWGQLVLLPLGPAVPPAPGLSAVSQKPAPCCCGLWMSEVNLTHTLTPLHPHLTGLRWKSGGRFPFLVPLKLTPSPICSDRK